MENFPSFDKISFFVGGFLVSRSPPGIYLIDEIQKVMSIGPPWISVGIYLAEIAVKTEQVGTV